MLTCLTTPEARPNWLIGSPTLAHRSSLLAFVVGSTSWRGSGVWLGWVPLAKSDGNISKFLPLVLRHDPGAAEVVIDEHGWVDVGVLPAGASAHYAPLDRPILARIVSEGAKGRDVVDQTVRRIRASSLTATPVGPVQGFLLVQGWSVRHYGDQSSAVTDSAGPSSHRVLAQGISAVSA